MATLGKNLEDMLRLEDIVHTENRRAHVDIADLLKLVPSDSDFVKMDPKNVSFRDYCVKFCENCKKK